MAEILPEVDTSARIKVLGIGGGGGAAVERMLKAQLKGIDFAVINTDAQALLHSHAPSKIHIGAEATRGLGAGADPEVGKLAAEESEKEIYEAVKGTDMVFITLGEGGGTGTGAAPLIAAAAREAGALVVGIVTKPFTFEGERRRRSADQGIALLKENVDTLITIPNDRLLQMIDRKTSLVDAFSIVDDVLQQGVQGISNLITIHGLINLDFADIKAIMSNAGSALMGIGRAKGDNRAVEAARMAIDSPLLETSIEGARGVLFNVTGGRNMSMHEIDEAAKTITDAVDPDANIIFGAVLDNDLDDDILITVVATGFDGTAKATRHSTQVHHAETHQEGHNEERAVVDKPKVEEEPTYVNPVVLPGARKSFIDEPPQSHEANELTKSPRRFAPISSIEPEDNSAEELVEPHVSETKSLDEHSPNFETTFSDDATADDDLDVPAFIRRKVE
jgi:cell division protein FtsZ